MERAGAGTCPRNPLLSLGDEPSLTSALTSLSGWPPPPRQVLQEQIFCLEVTPAAGGAPGDRRLTPSIVHRARGSPSHH